MFLGVFEVSSSVGGHGDSPGWFLEHVGRNKQLITNRFSTNQVTDKMATLYKRYRKKRRLVGAGAELQQGGACGAGASPARRKCSMLAS
eukprot:4907104-Prymnesium_polylepis.1